MKINRNNYEIYFSDYLEGTLDEKLMNSFLDFVNENPDLKEELALANSISIVPEDISFDKKNKLYKSKYDVEETFNNTAIASLEGELNTSERLAFKAYLKKNTDREKEAEAFKKTKLVADESIVFSKKEKLYRKPSLKKIVTFWVASVAAILFVAFAFFSLQKNTPNATESENKIVSIQPKKEKPEEENRATKQKKDKQVVNYQAKNTLPTQKRVVTVKKRNTTTTKKAKKKIEKEVFAVTREPLELIAKMQATTATINNKAVIVNLVEMPLTYPRKFNVNEERLLADRVREKVNFNKIKKVGLSLLSNISKEKFTYQTNSKGQVVQYKYDSRLLAFSVPAKRIGNE